MSSRKRPLAEISQPHLTPSRYAPSTPHAIRALQQRSGAKTRSARPLRRASADDVRPDSIRAVLRRFAKISAPITKKRVATPSSVYKGKENYNHLNGQDDDNDSFLLNKPNLTFAVDESSEDDSELPAAPTPSVLPEDDDDDDSEQPTATFHNVLSARKHGSIGEALDRRKSGTSAIEGEQPQKDSEEEQHDGDVTIMTERGRRAISEEVTGRFTRYSFGSIRMSDFGSELEVRRESAKYNDSTQLEDDYMPLAAEDDFFQGGETENLRRLQPSPGAEPEDYSVQMSPVGDETFRLEIPDDQVETAAHQAQSGGSGQENVVLADLGPELGNADQSGVESNGEAEKQASTSRRQTLLETAVMSAQRARSKRIKLTRHGTTVPSLPSSLIKRVVLDSYEKQSKRKPQLGRDHMKALEQATEWFFEQAGEDLAAYSSHGRRRKRVDIDDVLLLMKRQKVLGDENGLRRMAKSWLPKELVNELDLPEPV